MAIYLGKDKIAGISTSQSTVDNNLKLPEAASGVQQIVSINTDGTQQNLTLGTGITIQDGVINAISQSSNPKLYQHNFRIYDGMYGIEIYFTLINSTSTQITTIAGVASALNAQGFLINAGLMANGANLKSGTGIRYIKYVYANGSDIGYSFVEYTWSLTEEGTLSLGRSEGATSVYSSSVMTQIRDTVSTLLS